jgi:hypothetical protein
VSVSAIVPMVLPTGDWTEAEPFLADVLIRAVTRRSAALC